MRIIVDVMGGDNAPDAIALGAIEAAKEEKLDVVLVGRGEAILQCLKNHGIETLPAGVEIANADDVVDMHDDPAAVIKTRKNSSMLVGLQMLKDGGGDAFVSAGSTGALLTAATLIVKRIKGVRRAAMGPVLPTKTGGAVLIDCGATAECTPEFLLQFAFMGSYCARKLLGVEQPRVALLNNGSEETKGTELQQKAFELLRQTKLNFIGNCEGRDLPADFCDVVVCDGFVGNVVLKLTEGVAKTLLGMLKKIFLQNLITKLSYLGIKGGLGELKRMMDSEEVGGAPLLGAAKPVIKAHGSSHAKGIKNAIRQAKLCVANDLCGTMEKALAEVAAQKEEADA